MNLEAQMFLKLNKSFWSKETMKNLSALNFLI